MFIKKILEACKKFERHYRVIKLLYVRGFITTENMIRLSTMSYACIFTCDAQVKETVDLLRLMFPKRLSTAK